jgi:hypothetical protein
VTGNGTGCRTDAILVHAFCDPPATTQPMANMIVVLIGAGFLGRRTVIVRSI